MTEAEREAAMEGEPGLPAPSVELAVPSFDEDVSATVKNAPASLQEMAWMARAVCRSVTLPRAIQNRPADVLAVMLAGRELGLGPMAATRWVHIIGGQTVIATELKLALAGAAGHDIVALAEGPGWCVVGCATHPESGATGWRMQGETPVGAVDYPGLTGWTIAGEIMVESWEGQGSSRRKVEVPLVDKSNWRSYERDMLFWRGAGQFMRRHCPAVGGGMYTSEELEASDSEG